jgi:hypothetical protein
VNTLRSVWLRGATVNSDEHFTSLRIPYRLYAALDLLCAHSVLGSMDAEGRWRGTQRFATFREQLEAQVAALGGEGVCLTLEASALTRWAAGLVRPLASFGVARFAFVRNRRLSSSL